MHDRSALSEEAGAILGIGPSIGGASGEMETSWTNLNVNILYLKGACDRLGE
jgi:hypothetical protein